jgi:hypothetical protein
MKAIHTATLDRLSLPIHLQGLFFDWLWETERVWSLPTPVSHLPVEDLAWQLDLTVWTTVRGQPLFDLAPAQVLAAPAAHPRHWAKIQSVDLSYPLELFQNGRRWVILDGYNRLCRHHLSRSEQVPVRLHPDSCRELIRNNEASDSGDVAAAGASAPSAETSGANDHVSE